MGGAVGGLATAGGILAKKSIGIRPNNTTNVVAVGLQKKAEGGVQLGAGVAQSIQKAREENKKEDEEEKKMIR